MGHHTIPGERCVAVVTWLTTAGADVAITYTSSDPSSAAADLSKETGVKVQAFKCEVTDSAQVNSAIEDVEKAFGQKVDIGIACAGIALWKAGHDNTDGGLSAGRRADSRRVQADIRSQHVRSVLCRPGSRALMARPPCHCRRAHPSRREEEPGQADPLHLVYIRSRRHVPSKASRIQREQGRADNVVKGRFGAGLGLVGLMCRVSRRNGRQWGFLSTRSLQ